MPLILEQSIGSTKGRKRAMNIVQIRCFWEAVKTGNFTEAAERLYLSQPMLSKNISALEKELGFLLFERRGRCMTPTLEGQKLLQHFAEMLAVYERTENAIEAIRKAGRLPNEALSMALVPIVEKLGIISQINRFTSINPSFNPSIEIMDESQVILSLQAGSCNIAFCSNLKLDEKLYNIKKHSTHRFNVVVSQNHALAKKDSLSLKDLKGEKLILLDPESMLWGLCVHACEVEGFFPTVVLTICRPDIALEYIRDSDCAYMALDIEMKGNTSDIYKIIELKDSPEFDFVFAWRKADILPPAAKEYIEYALDHANNE